MEQALHHAQDAHRSAAPVGEFDAIVIGAGFAGLYALHKLRQQGLKVRVLEAGRDVGGTWYWNQYPGSRCDIESLEYSYSFDDDLQQEWHWPERFATAPDIQRYASHVSERFDLRKDIQFSIRVVSAVFDSKKNLWTVHTDQGQTLSAPICVMATGNLSLPRVPRFPGLENFKGKWYHSGLWPKEGVDFTGQRVGVIGTGSSGIQIIQAVAKKAKHLHVFQRTANFSVPAHNRPTTDEYERSFKDRYAAVRAEERQTPFAIAGHQPPTRSALEASPQERQAAYEKKWQTGGNISFLYAYNDLMTNREANETACEFVRGKIRQIVKDPRTAELLCPKGHPIGAKRLCMHTDYFDVYNRDNVTLVDAKSAPLQEVTAKGIRSTEAEYELDAIIFATGFDAMTGALLDIDIQTDDGQALRSKWSGGPRTYLGLMTSGFPNLFIITGPGSPSVKTNMISSIEQHVDWIADCVAHMRANGYTRIDPVPAAENDWVDHVNEVADRTLYPLADSWYVGANIPGKPRVFMPYVAGLDKYRKICEQIAQDGYRGFALSR